MPLFNPRVKTDLSGFALIGKVIQSIKAHHEEEARKKEIEKLLPAKYRGLTIGLSSKELGLLMSKVLLSKRQTREKAAASAEHERQISERQTGLETERAKAASDLESQRQQGREKIQEMRSTGKASKTPKADDAGLLIDQLESSEDGETRRLGRDLRDSVEKDFGDPNVLRQRAVKLFAEHSDEGAGSIYSQANLQRLNRALAGKTGAGSPTPAAPAAPAPAQETPTEPGVPRGTSAAPTPGGGPSPAALSWAKTLKDQGYSRADLDAGVDDPNLQKPAGTTPEELRGALQSIFVSPQSQGEAIGQSMGGSREGVALAARAGAGKPFDQNILQALVRGAQGGWANAAAGRNEPGTSLDYVGRKVTNTIPEALPLMSPGGGALAMGATLGRPMLESALPQMQDDPWSQPGDFTAGTSDPFKVDQRLRGEAAQRQVGLLLKSLLGVP